MSPCTDGHGDQAGYARSVKLWKLFQEKLPATNPNKLLPELQGIMLMSQLYGRAQYLCKSIPKDVVSSSEGADAIFQAVFNSDPLVVVKEIFTEFMQLIALKRGDQEGFASFESRFLAQAARFNSHFEYTVFSESFLAFLLLGNANSG